MRLMEDGKIYNLFIIFIVEKDVNDVDSVMPDDKNGMFSLRLS